MISTSSAGADSAPTAGPALVVEALKQAGVDFVVVLPDQKLAAASTSCSRPIPSSPR